MGNINEGFLDYNPCLTAVRRLHDYLSHELTPDGIDAIERHLAECQGCFARFHFEESLKRAIQARVGEVHLPPALHARILDRLHTLETTEDFAHEAAHALDGELAAADAV